MSDTLRLVGGSIIDPTTGDARSGQLTIREGRIAEVADRTEVPATTTSEPIDVSGLFLTPGLIDAHVHLGLSSPIGAQFGYQISAAELAADIFNAAGQALDAGFTTLRDVGGIDGGLVRAISAGKVRGPRVITCGPVQCQTGGHGYYGAAWEPTELWETHHVPGLCALSLMSGNADELRRNVRETFRRGATFLKLCVTGGVVGGDDSLEDTQFSPEEIAVAVQEARARGTYVTVHAHNNAGIRNAVLAGVTCVEHGTDIDEATAQLMVERGVAHVPTFAVIDQLLEHSADAGLTESVAAKLSGVKQRMVQALAASREAGVKIGMGSDLIGPQQHHRGDELRIRAELEDPALALHAATVTNAEILGISDDVGSLQQGKVADVVAWSIDPMHNPKAFADPDNAVLVVKAGQIVKDIR